MIAASPRQWTIGEGDIEPECVERRHHVVRHAVRHTVMASRYNVRHMVMRP